MASGRQVAAIFDRAGIAITHLALAGTRCLTQVEPQKRAETVEAGTVKAIAGTP